MGPSMQRGFLTMTFPPPPFWREKGFTDEVNRGIGHVGPSTSFPFALCKLCAQEAWVLVCSFLLLVLQWQSMMWGHLRRSSPPVTGNKRMLSENCSFLEVSYMESYWISPVTVHLSHVQLFMTPWTIAHQAPLSMGFSRQEYWSGLSFPPPGDLPDPGIKPISCVSALQADSFMLELSNGYT